jgi:hypothetical protein
VHVDLVAWLLTQASEIVIPEQPDRRVLISGTCSVMLTNVVWHLAHSAPDRDFS